MKTLISLILTLALSISNSVCAEEINNRIRIAALPFGTLNWELDVIQKQNLDRSNGLAIEVVTVANPQAGKIALNSGAVDMIVSDWLWVARQRQFDRDVTFVPFSTTSGELIVPPGSTVKSLSDLQGISLGIAGGELDKNWVLLRALAQQQEGVDLNNTVNKKFGSPPLLNQQLLHNNIDALLTYWHYAVRLEAQGYRRILTGAELLSRLGIKQRVPTLGFVFNQHWAKNKPKLVQRFFEVSNLAKDSICESDDIWDQVKPLTGTDDSKDATTTSATILCWTHSKLGTKRKGRRSILIQNITASRR